MIAEDIMLHEQFQLNSSSSQIMINEAGSTPTSFPHRYIFSTVVPIVNDDMNGLIRNAAEHVQKVAFLPIDLEMESFVDSIINEATSNAKSSPLTRRI